MSAPILFIFLPAFASIVLWFFRRERTVCIAVGTGLSLLLGLIAFFEPINEIIVVGPWSLVIKSDLVFLGRRLVLEQGDRYFLSFFYGLGAIWFLISRTTGTRASFLPFSLLMMSFLTAALAVEPFLYAALIIEFAVLFSIPMLASPGRPPGRGLMRFLVFQTLAIPVILMAGWVLGNSGTNPSDFSNLMRAAVLLGLGFACWLAVFPLHTWMPMLAEEADPFPVGYLLTFLPISILILSLQFTGGYSWLQQVLKEVPALRLIGTVMVVTGGIWAAFQNDLRRLFAFTVMIDNGFLLVMVGMQSKAGLGLFTAGLPVRVLMLGVMTVGLSMLHKYGMSFNMGKLTGLLKRSPAIAISLMIGLLSALGLPLTGLFSIRLSALQMIAQQSTGTAVWMAAGLIGLALAIARLFIRFSFRMDALPEEKIERLDLAVCWTGIILLLVVGIFPQLLQTGFVKLVQYIPFIK